jgi:hypothetical protein
MARCRGRRILSVLWVSSGRGGLRRPPLGFGRLGCEFPLLYALRRGLGERKADVKVPHSGLRRELNSSAASRPAMRVSGFTVAG